MNKIIQSLIFLTFVLYLGKSVITKLPLIVYSETPSLPTYKVKQGSVYDGDTMRVIDNKGHEFKIRFACIDTREMGQLGGDIDRNFLRQLLDKHNNRVKLEIITTDRYNRTVAVVWAGDTLVQEAQVKAGYAFVYDKYANDCPYYEQIKSAEAIARKKKLGIWNQEKIEYPWDWRTSSKK